jgi:hypothetical protein
MRMKKTLLSILETIDRDIHQGTITEDDLLELNKMVCRRIEKIRVRRTNMNRRYFYHTQRQLQKDQ